jgi:hypothetical protein
MLNHSENKHAHKVLKRDKEGRVLKTYDGKVYRIYDSLGRRIEDWGNLKEPDFDIYFHSIIYYTDTTIFQKEYWLGYDNPKCIIKDTADYNGHFYKFDNNGKLIYYENTVSLTNDIGNVTGRKLTDKGNALNFDVKRFYSLPNGVK